MLGGWEGRRMHGPRQEFLLTKESPTDVFTSSGSTILTGGSETQTRLADEEIQSGISFGLAC